MRLAILGGPGSGKGTQAKLLARRYRVPQISTGDLLREAVQTNEKLKKAARAALDGGHLVDNQTVLDLLEERLRKRDTKRGFIIDGYPRNIPQAQTLDNLLGLMRQTLQIAINIKVNDKILLKRIAGRFACAKCGAIYNRYLARPLVEDKCDHCGHKKFTSRRDDTEQTVKTRIAVYYKETAPLITYYHAQHKLRTTKGEGKMADIHERLCEIIDLEIRPLEMNILEMATESNGETEFTVIAGGKINRIEVSRKKQKLTPQKRALTQANLAANQKIKIVSRQPVRRSKKSQTVDNSAYQMIVEEILKHLNQNKIRCTYGVLGELLTLSNQLVSRYLGDRRPLASWVVNAQTGHPSKYIEAQKHKDLYSNKQIITTLDELFKQIPSLRAMKK